MKTIFVSATLLLASAGFAQKMKSDEVPQAVRSTFQTNFKDAKAEWEKEKNGNYEAEFKMSGVETSATFSADGKWLETEQEIKTSELPASATQYIAKNYAGYKTEEAEKITMANGTVQYEAELKKAGEKLELIFDASGNFKEKKKEEKD